MQMKAKNGRTIEDLTGQKFGRWTVIKHEYINDTNIMWFCECECGEKRHLKSWALRSGRSKSCGCLHKEIMTKHGTSHLADYKHDIWLVKQYGITLADYDELLEEQNGECAICGTTDPKGKGRFHVDHDHDSGEVRGLLCHHCNVGLGNFKDNTETLMSAINYLNIAGKLKG